jgi:hypothetical protein
MAGQSAQGTTFSFSGSLYSCTRVSVSQSKPIQRRNKISIATLATSIDTTEPFIYGFLPIPEDAEKSVEIEYIGGAVISVGTSGALSTSLVGGGNATVTASSISAAVGDLIRGTATFKVA